MGKQVVKLLPLHVVRHKDRMASEGPCILASPELLGLVL